MKKMKLIFSVLLLFAFVITSDAQILNKMKNAIKNKVERKVVDKVSDKAEEKTEDAMDDVFNPEGMKMGFQKNKVDASLVPHTYQFSWKYSLEVQAEDGKAMVLDYLLEPNAEYFGFNLGQANEMLMIMDWKNKLTISCFGSGAGKMATASKILDYSEMAEDDKYNNTFSYKTLPNKVFLGFDCKGLEATNEEYVMVFYYTNEAKIGFSDMFKSQPNKKMPDAFKKYFKPGDNPLMMYMNMKELNNKGKETIMKCVAIEKDSYVFNKSDYKFM